MPQNRNKLISLFIGNIANAALHKILEEAVDDEVLRKYYDKELLNSIKIAGIYREKINPTNRPLPQEDIEHIKNKIANKINRELRLRVEKGYKNINIDSVSGIVDKMLIEMRVKD